VTPGRRRPTGPPPSAGVLARYAQAHAREVGVAEGRVRAWVDAIALTDAFGVTGPAQLPCLPLRFHVAQKLHGMTLPPRPGKQNERFRDLVDLLLMEGLVSHDYPALRRACELVFGSRNTHGWPPNLDGVPSHWAAPFTQLARELELPDTDVETALIRVRNFVGRILSAGS